MTDSEIITVSSKSLIDDYTSWSRIKLRLENNVTNTILFGTFNALVSAFLYKQSSAVQTAVDNSKIINVELLFSSSILFMLAAFIRYATQFIFTSLCPALIQVNKDLDDLLKKSKDTINDVEDWPTLIVVQINLWNRQNYKKVFFRILVSLLEIIVVLVFFLGLFVFFRSSQGFLLSALHF